MARHHFPSDPRAMSQFQGLPCMNVDWVECVYLALLHSIRHGTSWIEASPLFAIRQYIRIHEVRKTLLVVEREALHDPPMKNFFSAGREEEWRTAKLIFLLALPHYHQAHTSRFAAITQYPAPDSDEIAN